VKVGKGAVAYSSRATWAEPHIDVAAEMMKTVYENPGQAQAKALAVVGLLMKARLGEIWETLDGR
jgi:hypothetical protein